MELFKIDNLSFSYDKSIRPSIKNINLSIRQGDFLVICGTSGSGKSTLVRQLKSCFTPLGAQTGTILFKGRPLSSISVKEQAQSIGYVPQGDFSQVPVGNVINQLAFGPLNIGMKENQVKLHIAEISNVLGISDILYKNSNDISGGQKQLVKLASVLIMNPDIIILDEPFSSLDPFSANALLDTLNKVNNDFSTAVLVSSSSLETLCQYAQNIIFIENGKISSNFKNIRECGIINDNYIYNLLPEMYKIHSKVNPNALFPPTLKDGKNFFNELFKDKNVNFRTAEEYREKPEANQILSLKNIWFKYKKNSPDILKDLNLSVKSGEIISILGKNGSGKSTLLNLICKTFKPYKGKITINNKPIYKYSDSELFGSIISMIPQYTETYYDNVNLQLCHGEKQILYIKNTLKDKNNPIIVMDEPTAGIDSNQKRELLSIIREASNNGSAIIIASHDLEFCSEASHKCCMLFDGQIIGLDTKNKFFSNNTFYTTVPRIITSDIFENAVTSKEVIKLCLKNGVI